VRKMICVLVFPASEEERLRTTGNGAPLSFSLVLVNLCVLSFERPPNTYGSVHHKRIMPMLNRGEVPVCVASFSSQKCLDVCLISRLPSVCPLRNSGLCPSSLFVTLQADQMVSEGVRPLGPELHPLGHFFLGSKTVATRFFSERAFHSSQGFSLSSSLSPPDSKNVAST
jgi:hypothetical protein